MPDVPIPDIRIRRASLGPTSIDASARRFTAVVATDAGVRVVLPDGRRVIERLSCEPGAVDLSRAEAAGIPLLDGHGRGTRDVLGRMQAHAFEPGRLIGTFQFTAAADAAPVWQRVQDGSLRAVSAGYTVQTYESAEPASDGTPVLIATRWTLHEVSLVSIPADAGATVRGDRSTLALKEEGTMPDHNMPASPAPEVLDERARIASLDAPFEQARAMGLNETAIAVLRTRAVNEGWDADTCQARLFAAIAGHRALAEEAEAEQRTMPRIWPRPVCRFGNSFDDPAFIRQRQAAAVAAQALGTPPPEEAREFMQHRGIVEQVRADLARRHRDAWRWSRDRIVSDMIGRAFHTTSDFPSLFADSMNRMLVGLNDATPQPWRMVCAPRTVPDFRGFKTVSVAGPSTLEELPEAGEVTLSTIHTRDEVGQLATYARNFAVTRQALVNDDLAALADVARLYASGITATYRSLFLPMFASNGSGWGPTMSDGNPLFSAAHGNVTGGTASTAGVSALRALLRKQVDVNGNVLALGPRYLLTGPDSETALAQVVSSTAGGFVAVAENQRPVFTDMTVVTEAALGGAPFFAFVDPALRPVLQLVHLDGRQGAQIEVFPAGPSRDGVTFRCLLDTAIVAVGWVGAARATGA